TSALRKCLPSFVVAFLLFVFLARMDAATVQYATTGRWDYLTSQPFVWVHYVRLFFLPVGLTADTDWDRLVPWWDTRDVVGVLFLVALVAVTLRLAAPERLRPAALGLAWFAIALVPSSTIFPLAEVYNEHRVFFPYVGSVLAVAWCVVVAVRSLPRGRAVARAAILSVAAVAVILAHAAGTHARNEAWRTEETLWKDVTE